ncbi:hypothetical protein EMIT0133MI5_50169 [Bacillus velezensis]
MQAVKQLSFIPEVNEKEVRNIVIKELKMYRSLKTQAENRQEQKEKESSVCFRSYGKTLIIMS